MAEPAERGSDELKALLETDLTSDAHGGIDRSEATFMDQVMT